MPTSIALFRGLNVGGKNLLPMRELVAVLESLGYTKVRTYIQSGNAVFDHEPFGSRDAAREIGQAVRDGCGLKPRILLLDSAQLAAAIAANPFPTDDGKALHFYFLDSPPVEPDLATLAARQAESEAFELTEAVFYLHAPEGIGRSKLAASVERGLGVPATARNWNTVRKLAAMIGQV